MWALVNGRTAVAINTFVRLIAGVGVFILMARFLGPVQFGVAATTMAVAGVASLLSDFGLPIYCLRAAAMEPSRLRAIMTRALLLKALLTAMVLIPASFVLIWLDLTPSDKFSVALLFVAVLIAGIAELCFVAVRAVERFELETAPVIFTSGLSLVLVGAVAATTGDLLITSAAFLTSRLVYLLVAYVTMTRLVAGQVHEPVRAGLLPLFSASKGFAADGLVTNLSGQIDVLLAPLVLSIGEAGIYQAGARIVQVIGPLAMILATVHIPRLARLSKEGDAGAFLKHCDLVSFEYFVLALLILAGFCVVLGPLTPLIFGPAYLPLQQLWPVLGLAAALRIFSSGAGVRLAALGRSYDRVIGHVVAVVFVVTLTFAFYSEMHFSTLAWIIVGGSLALNLVFSLCVSRFGWRFKDHVVTILAIAVAVLVFFSIR